MEFFDKKFGDSSKLLCSKKFQFLGKKVEKDAKVTTCYIFISR